MKLNKVLKFIFLGLFASTTSAQIYADSVVFKSGFTFNQGIYRTREDFRTNNPSLPNIQVVDVDCEIVKIDLAPFPYKKDIVTNLSYVDEKNNRIETDTSSFFGFCRNNYIYIRQDCYLFRLYKVGAICIGYATSNKKLLNPDVLNINLNPNDDLIIRPVFYTKDVMCLYDFNQKKFKPYNSTSLEKLLEAEPKLLEEFSSINSDKKKFNSIWMYVEKYNQIHPIYFKNYN